MSQNLIFINRRGEKVTKPANIKVQKRMAVYGIAIVRNQLLMVGPTWHKLWELPGGKVELNEAEDIALAREYFEETGYKITAMDIKPIKTLKSQFYNEDKDIYYYSTRKYYAITDLLKTDSKPKYADEINKCEWIDIFSLTKTNCQSDVLKIIHDLIKKLSKL